MPGAGGARCDCHSMDAPINSGSRLNGRSIPNQNSVASGFDKSATHRKWSAPRNSIAKRIIGNKTDEHRRLHEHRQSSPPIGLGALFFFQSSICFDVNSLRVEVAIFP